MTGCFSGIGFRAIMAIIVSVVIGAGCSKESTTGDSAHSEPSVEHGKVTHAADPSEAGWQLVWQDEFDAGSVDDKKWSRAVDCWGGGNDELQCYSDRPENAFVEDSVLHMVATEENFSGPKFSEVHPQYSRDDTSKTSPFTSARLHTKDKMSIRYGRVDIRAKIAGGKGMWPALWMLPNDNVYGNWPASGEIDIMEALNAGIGPHEVHGTLHYGLPWPQWENKVDEFHMDANPADYFHVYSIEWEAGQIRWYVDGKHYQTQSAAGWYNYIWRGQEQGYQVANPRAPFDQEFYLIMNIAIGGNWPGDPDRDWPADREMLVDYVRVYQCGEGNSDADEYTGEGCAAVDPAVALNADSGAPGTHEFTLYADGPETLSFDVDGGVITNALLPGQWASAAGSVAQEHVDLGADRGRVWDIKFSGESNVFLTSKELASLPGYESGLMLGGGSGWVHNGEVEFDVLVKNASADSQLAVKLDSGAGKAGSAAITLPSAGEWQHVAVKIADILANPRAEDGGVDLTNVVNAFVLEHTGSSAHIQVDNVRLQCAYNIEPEPWQQDQTCDLYPREIPPIPVFTRINDVEWTVWDCCGGADFAEVNDEQADGSVVEFTFGEKATVSGYKAPQPLDMTLYSGGTLEFDFKQVSPPPEGSAWYVKLEAAITAAEVFLTDGGPMPSDSWQHYVFPLKGEMVKGQMDNADMSNIKLLLVFPEWGNAEGAVMRIDNVKFVAP